MITFAESTAESESQYNTALTNLQQSWKTAHAECNNNECCKKLSPLFESDSNYKNIVNNYTTAFDNTQSCWYYGVNGCNNCYETNGNIVCNCSDNSGNIASTSLSESCVSEQNNYVTNCNGQLMCVSECPSQ